MEASNVFIFKMEDPSYPTIPPFHPSKLYPEYQFKEISNEKNKVYNAFRKMLYFMGLDKENWDKKNWNPLKQIISPGDNVLIKPNLVIDNLKNQDAITTHTSLIRAIIDYVLIALKGKGKITIGDAPLQKCDFKILINNNNLVELVDYFKSKSVDIDLIDFRRERMIVRRDKITKSLRSFNVLKLNGDPRGYKIINLKGKSNLHEISYNNGYKKFRVTNYDPKMMKKAHNNTDHKYIISNSVIQADVMINIAKIKAHRKAGFTGCLKNFVGINGSKDWLPHHQLGSIFEGGDEYHYKNLLKKIYNKLNEIEDLLLIKYPKIHNFLYYPTFYIKALVLKISSKISKDNYLEGSWYGNDTLWRTIADLNQIIIYTNKKGRVTNESQRKRLFICDGVYSGQSEGPLEPIPIKSGLIMGGFDPLMVDLSIAELMNLNYKKIPQLYKLFGLKNYPISKYKPRDLLLLSNNKNWNKKRINELTETLTFIPSSGWKNNIKK
ncbi:MAG: DUF362 domain-containing protein [Promethearchaeota archaeon]